MNEKSLQELKSKLEKEKKSLEETLGSFAKKDKKHPGDWDTKYPKLDGGSGGSVLERAADEVEEYATRLPIEYSLETKLKNANLALEKIRKGKYGFCESCKKPISIKRLDVSPEARLCLKCLKNKK